MVPSRAPTSADAGREGPEDRRAASPTAQDVLWGELTRPRPGSRRTFFGGAAGLAALVALAVWGGFDWEAARGAIHQLNPWLLVPLMAVLPIGGFSISVVYLLAGARFGPAWGGLVVAGVTAVHLAGTYGVARSFLRQPLERYLGRRGARLPAVPAADQPLVGVIATLAPGLPYALRNYALVLAGVGLGPLFLVCLPIYVARSTVVLLLGDAAGDLGRMGWLLGLDLLRATACALLIWRWRVRHLARRKGTAPV